MTNRSVNSDDPWEFFVYDDSWRLVAAYKNTGSTPYSISSTASLKERYVPHAAGLDGRGGSSYIDSMAVRDLDLTGDATLEERGYFLQNWRADLVGVMRPDGVLPGWFKYSAYGKHQEVLLADVDDGNGTGVRDGGLTTDDLLYYLAQFELGTGDSDITNDGGVSIDDLLLYIELFEAGGPATTSRVMYAGYQYDAKVDLYHVRHRVYSTDLGSWLTQDPLGLTVGMSLYEYCVTSPQTNRDPSGLEGEPIQRVPTGPGTSLTVDQCKPANSGVGRAAGMAEVAHWMLKPWLDRLKNNNVVEQLQKEWNDCLSGKTLPGGKPG